MLTKADGKKGKNFITEEIYILAKNRISQKTGAVDDYRLLHNMLSSMPMCFNLFGPLKNDLGLASKLISALLPDEEVSEVTNIVFEFNPSPRKDYLNDRSAFDIFVEFLTLEEDLAFIGIEAKLTEPFSLKEHRNPLYDYWTAMDEAPWKKEFQGELFMKDVNQLWRNHLLVQALMNVQSEKYSKGFFMTVYHQDDTECKISLDRYFSYLKNPHNASEVSIKKIRELWEPIIINEKDKSWFEKFCNRYLDLKLSETEFMST